MSAPIYRKFAKYDIVHIKAYAHGEFEYMVLSNYTALDGTTFNRLIDGKGAISWGWADDELIIANNPNMAIWSYWIPSDANDAPDTQKDLKIELPEGTSCPVKWKPKTCTCGAYKTYGEGSDFHSTWCDKYESK